MNALKSPHLPQKNVITALAGELIAPYEEELGKNGVKIVKTVPNLSFSSSLGFHADLFANFLGKGRILLDSSQQIVKSTLQNYGFECKIVNKKVTDKYPGDCLLNCTVTDRLCICFYDITADEIKEYINENSLTVVNSKQGYSKCSVLPVSDNAFITDDISVYNALKSAENDVLYTEKGSVELKGFPYGFIGGCAGKISNDCIAVCGDIKLHKDFDNIKSFCRNYKTELMSLGNGQPEDIGSIIPLTEE